MSTPEKAMSMTIAPGPTGAARARTIRSVASSTEAVAGCGVPSTTTSAEEMVSSALWRAMVVTASWAVASIRTSPLKVAASRSGASRSS